MTRFLARIAISLSLVVVAACGADDVVDQATDKVGETTNDAVASQLSGLLVDNTELSETDADCVAGDVVDRLGATTVVTTVIETGGDFSKLSAEDRDRVVAAVTAAGETCSVDVGDVTG